MIKLTTTQAKAVASKIRERILLHNDGVRKQLRENYLASDEYQNKLKEIHEIAIVVWQASVKVGLTLGIGISGHYGTSYMYKEEDIKDVEKRMSDALVSDYLHKNDTTKTLPTEDQLVTDLIFESLTSEGIEDLMNKFIEQYL